MCGITILVHKKRSDVDRSLLERMTERVRHRGPDGEGYRIWDNVGFGHRRLAIIDLTSCGAQPMTYGALTLVFNGAIYNHAEIRTLLTKQGYSFVGHSDTEVLLKSWHCWGIACLEKLRGMWAFSVFDEDTRKLYLCRDRFGIKPLHYTHTENYFAAGSEIKQFFELPDFDARPFEPALFDFLRFGVSYYNSNTFYDGVFSVPAGHLLCYDTTSHRQEIVPYYDLEKQVAQCVADTDAAQGFRQGFEEAVALHLVSDAPLGLSLSGGLDSSAIVCQARALVQKEVPLNTITTCNEHQAYDETAYAHLVEQHCETQGHYVYPDLTELFTPNTLRRINYYHDGPIPGGSHFSEYSVFQKASQLELRVLLGGQGSDEMLGGYPEFFMYHLLEKLPRMQWKSLLQALGNRARNRNLKRSRLLAHLAYQLLMSYSNIRQRGPGKFVSARWMHWLTEKYPSYFPSYKGFLGIRNFRQASIAEIVSLSIPYQLHSEDRNSMMFSVESRTPFLDHKLVERVLALPADSIFDGGRDKMPLREGLKDLLPPGIYQRNTKLGFASSDEVWMRKHPEATEMLLSEACDFLEGKIQKKAVMNHWQLFTAGRVRYDPIFFRLISLHAWLINLPGFRQVPET